MHCAVCSAYLAKLHEIPKARGKISHCSGCRPRDKQCAYIKGSCSRLSNGRVTYCFECPTFPCDRLKKIDNRYRTTYNMSFIENLELIKDRGEQAFLKLQQKRFGCDRCGALTSIHNGKCYVCDKIVRWKK